MAQQVDRPSCNWEVVLEQDSEELYVALHGSIHHRHVLVFV